MTKPVRQKELSIATRKIIKLENDKQHADETISKQQEEIKTLRAQLLLSSKNINEQDVAAGGCSSSLDVSGSPPKKQKITS